ncbi:MAG: RidA family protein [Nocardiopsaceae bacterium]|nr:RidA family protein [Nocardiopsaceae bacterium]
MTESHSDALPAGGPLVFVSGRIPKAPDGGIVQGGAVEQARRVGHVQIDATACLPRKARSAPRP